MSHASDWEQHWSHYDEAAQLNPAQSYRRKLVFSTLGPKASRIIDLGSGQGDLLRDAHAVLPHAELVGIDYSEVGIGIARQKAPSARFFQANFADENSLPPELNGWASHIVCTEVLEHLDDPSVVLRNARKMLQPGGELVVTVPGGPRTAFDKHIGHRRHYSPSALRKLGVGAGYKAVMVAGAGFPFFNLYRLVVLSRGKKLIEDVKQTQLSFPARTAMRTFDVLFKLNRTATPFGWQTLGVFRRV